MRELELRKWHRRVGTFLAFFLFLQATSGILLSLEGLPIWSSQAHIGQEMGQSADFETQAQWDPVGSLHHGGGGLGALYRLLLGAGTLWMAFSGSWIYWRVKRRSAGRRQ